MLQKACNALERIFVLSQPLAPVLFVGVCVILVELRNSPVSVDASIHGCRNGAAAGSGGGDETSDDSSRSRELSADAGGGGRRPGWKLAGPNPRSNRIVKVVSFRFNASAPINCKIHILKQIEKKSGSHVLRSVS